MPAAVALLAVLVAFAPQRAIAEAVFTRPSNSSWSQSVAAVQLAGGIGPRHPFLDSREAGAELLFLDGTVDTVCESAPRVLTGRVVVVRMPRTPSSAGGCSLEAACQRLGDQGAAAIVVASGGLLPVGAPGWLWYTRSMGWRTTSDAAKGLPPTVHVLDDDALAAVEAFSAAGEQVHVVLRGLDANPWKELFDGLQWKVVVRAVPSLLHIATFVVSARAWYVAKAGSERACVTLVTMVPAALLALGSALGICLDSSVLPTEVQLALMPSFPCSALCTTLIVTGFCQVCPLASP